MNFYLRRYALFLLWGWPEVDINIVLMPLGSWFLCPIALLSTMVARRVLETLRWLHEELKIMHRDLKPENLLFATEARNSDTAMLIDFGLACPINRPEDPTSGDHPGKHEEDAVVGSGWSTASASRLRLPPGSCTRSSCGGSTGAQPKRGCRGLAGTVDYQSPQQLWHLPEMKDIQQMLAARIQLLLLLLILLY